MTSMHNDEAAPLERNRPRPDGNQALSPVVDQKAANGQKYTADTACKGSESTEHAQILDLPLEILNKIMSYLLPADVLSLARSNKSIRNLLMSRASRPLWQAAFYNIPQMPPCPQSLCEPQYASLVFSETCSTCGVKVPDGPDPYLRVRLCKLCRRKEIFEPDFDADWNILPLIPTSRVDWNIVQTLHSAFKYVKGYMSLSSVDKKAFEKWRVERIKEIQERRMHGHQLDRYLKQLESEKQQKIEDLRRERQDEVERRLISVGWTRSEILLRPHTSSRWQELVGQPEPITDQTWKKIYPTLVLLLWSNRAYDRAIERKNRRMDRVDRLYDLVTEFRKSLPPLLTVTPTMHSNIPSSRRYAKRANYRHLQADLPFPSMAEIMDWPFIKNIIGKDTMLGDFETAFMGLQPRFDQAVTKWRTQVDQDLLNIRCVNYGTGASGSEPSSRTNQISKVWGTTGSRSTAGASSSQSTAAPGFTVNFVKLNCLTTPTLPELSKAQQILLRADSRFMSGDRCQAYPYNISTVTQNGPGIDFVSRNKHTHGSRWDASKVKWDDVGSGIARTILNSLGFPGATTEEVGAFNGNFKCGRCEIRPYTFEGIVAHYRSEQTLYEMVQEAKHKNKHLSSITYNHIHDINSDGPPLVILITPQASAEYRAKRIGYQTSRRVCELCEPFGEYFQEQYAVIEGVELPLSQHQRDVHNKLRIKRSTHLFGWM